MKKQINFQERQLIELWLRNGEAIRRIAEQLNRSPSSISDEIKRNSDKNGYHAINAQAKSEKRISKSRSKNSLKKDWIIERKLIRMLRREAGFPIFSYVQFLLLNRKESPFISPGNYIYLIKIGGERQMIKVNRQMFYLADTGEFVEADVFPVSRTTRKLVTHSQHQKNQMDREALSQKEWQVLIFSQNYYLIRWFFGIAMIICVIWLIVTVF